MSDEGRRTVSEAASLKQQADERASGIPAVASSAIRSATAGIEAVVARAKADPSTPVDAYIGDLIEVETALQLALMSLGGSQTPDAAVQAAQDG
jgi:hypothetical protein